MSPVVSFVIPVYKVERYLRRCLDTVLAQTFTDWEAVCVNDGSPDSCLDILREYAGKDSRFVIIDKENGGLSDARNAGLEHCRGEWVVFVDSDDFIHPQTLEIALDIQKRSGAELVSWYKDSLYRTKLILRHFFHLEDLNYRPSSFKKIYDPSKVQYHFTKDVISVASEYSHPHGIANPLKHNYVWRHLIHRQLLEGISFVKGLAFEDFPWWSELLLKNPTTAYTDAKLYFYYFNLHSIDNGSSRAKKVYSWICGLERTYQLYRAKADSHQMECWSAQFKWPVLNSQIARHLIKLRPDSEKTALCREKLTALISEGILDDAATTREPSALKTAKMIRAFVGK